MSIHLQTVPIPFGMDPTTYLVNIAGPGAKVAKVNTSVTDYDLMQDIIANSTLGFKSKLDLRNFENRCIMYFEDNGWTVDITFIGNFTNNEVRSFVSNLNKEFNQITKKSYSTKDVETHFNNANNELKREIEMKKKPNQERLVKKHKQQNKIKDGKSKIEPIVTKKEKNQVDDLKNKSEKDIVIEETVLPENQYIISSNLKDKNIIDKVLNESYVGYNSKEELENFLNIGKISYNKTINGTYDFVFVGDYNKEEAKKYVDNITDDYALIVQEQTYLKVIEKIKKEELTLESEIVDSEDSIVLTLKI